MNANGLTVTDVRHLKIDRNSAVKQLLSLLNATVSRRCNCLQVVRTSWTHMSSQRGFRIGASCQTSFGTCLTVGEQTDVSLASHAARVASFVHCRTRGCEATYSHFYRDIRRILAFLPVSLFLYSFHYFIQHPSMSFDLTRIILKSNINARCAIEENAQVKRY